MKEDNGDLLADSHSILNRWKNYFSQVWNVHRVSDVKQIEIHTADPSPFEVEIAIAKLKRYKSPGCDEILAELIQAGGEICYAPDWVSMTLPTPIGHPWISLSGAGRRYGLKRIHHLNISTQQPKQLQK
jgi:hypothetical protein